MAGLEENKREFLLLCSQIKREGIDDLVNWLEKSDFFIAPASSRFHGCYEGGLLEHSLNVYHEFLRIVEAYPELMPYFDFVTDRNLDETIKIITLFHDLCKVNMYVTEKRNRKNSSGQWESYDAYTIDEAYKFGGHGSKSVYIVQNFIKLRPEEATAINCHMGAFSGEAQSVGSAFEASPLAWLLSMADQSASYVVEGFLQNKTLIWSKRTKWTEGWIFPVDTSKINNDDVREENVVERADEPVSEAGTNQEAG